MTSPVDLPAGTHYLMCRCGNRHAVVVKPLADGSRSVTVVPDWSIPDVVTDLIDAARSAADYALADILEPRNP